jgi:transcriptional regulator with XRE-family HTH domain
MPQDDWSEQLTRQIGQRLRHYRDERKLSAQKVADACAALGVPIERSVLASLENRRRSIITVAEIIALARVLDVAPLALIYPVGEQETVEALPGLPADPFAAAQWFAGESPFPGDDAASGAQTPAALDLYRSHARIVDELLQQIRVTQRLLNDPSATPGETRSAQNAVRAHADALKSARSSVRRLGMRVPPLPDAIGSVVEIDDDEEMYLDSESDEGAPSAAELLRQLLTSPDGPEKQALETRIKGLLSRSGGTGQ